MDQCWVDNVQADTESRVFNDQTEWMLDPEVYQELVQTFDGEPKVDLFATRINTQCEQYVTWRPDPHAVAIDALTWNWPHELMYCFPPFCIIHRLVNKVKQEQAEVIAVVPLWTTQPWFSALTRMLVDLPVLLPRRPDLLTLPYKPDQRHPLSQRL